MAHHQSAGQRARKAALPLFALLLVLLAPPAGRAAGPTIVYLPLVAAGPAAPSQVRITSIASGLIDITDVTHAGDQRLFIAEQGGQIRIVKNGGLLAAPFLDISTQVACCGERGLLGLAFHPGYASKSYFYINYTYPAADGLRSRVSRFKVSANPDVADPTSETVIIEFAQPFENHNGGALHFGPDGYLYIGTGDGGGAYDPQNNAQDTRKLLGKILRIDVDRTGGADCGLAPGRNYGIPGGNPFADGLGAACDEVWAYGLRNPWRFSFDRLTGDLWIGDVGQSSREEVDFQPAGSPGGQNYGWDCWEGTLPNTVDPSPACAAHPQVVAPIHDYDHGQGRCSITGGYVYRGAAQPRLNGQYFFADFCNGEIWTLRRTAAVATVTEMLVTGGVLTSPRTFGEDVNGELFVGTSSQIFRIE